MRTRKEILAEVVIAEDSVASPIALNHGDFDWGMLNGRLEALRWVLGNDRGTTTS